MTALSTMLADLVAGRIEVVDLTAPLSDRTPIIQLPPPFANTQGFALQEISRYDDRGPAWYWNNISAGEHVGTHFDAPVHWVTGRDGVDVAEVPADAVDRSGRRRRQERRVRRATRTFCSRSSTWRRGSASTARCRPAAGCCFGPAGTAAPTTRRRSSTPTRPARTRPGISIALRPVAGRAGPDHRGGRGDGRHRRRDGAQLRSAVSRVTRSCSARASTA